MGHMGQVKQVKMLNTTFLPACLDPCAHLHCRYHSDNKEHVRRAIMACDDEDATCVVDAKALVNDTDTMGSDTMIGLQTPPLGDEVEIPNSMEENGKRGEVIFVADLHLITLWWRVGLFVVIP